MSSCDPVLLDGSASSGALNKPLQFVWTLSRSSYYDKLTDAAFAIINQYLDPSGSNTNGTSPTLTIDPSILPSGRTYVWQLTVTNWIGASASTKFIVHKLGYPAQSVHFPQVGAISIAAADSLFTVIVVTLAACEVDTPAFLYTWSVVSDSSGFGYTFPAKVNKLNSESLSLPGGSLLAGTTYVFRVDVARQDNPTISNYDVMTVVPKTTAPPRPCF